MFSVRVQTEPIQLDSPTPPATGSQRDDCGAQVRFVGTVRNDARSAPISHLVLEHFPGVTESEIERIVGLACQRWALQKAQVVHRVGRINVGEDIVVVETASAHRKDAYEANVFIMDYLKTQAPFWKQECFTDGSEIWVEAKHSDQQAAERWAANGVEGSDAVGGETRGDFEESGSASPQRVGALILAGGQGSRMGHRNKGLQRLRGKPLVAHVMDALSPHVAYLAISANQDLDEYASLGLPVFQDDPRYALQGPLAGIASALPQFPSRLDAIVVAPCDVPMLPDDVVPRLVQALASPDVDCAIATTPGNAHHGVFILRPGMLLSLFPHLQPDGDKRLLTWLQSRTCAYVEFEDPQAFANINDLETLQNLE